jgi:hypothetical protein
MTEGSEQPEPSPEAEQAEIRVRIAADRENLGQTIEALAAKSQVGARAKGAARDTAVTAVTAGRRLATMPAHVLAAVPAHVLSGAATVWQRGMTATRPVRQRVAAVGTRAVDRVRAAGRPR